MLVPSVAKPFAMGSRWKTYNVSSLADAGHIENVHGHLEMLCIGASKPNRTSVRKKFHARLTSSEIATPS